MAELRTESHPRLLVSVRSADEALAAVRGGADVIDVKEPQRGSLGAASADVLSEICQTLPPTGFSGPISAALGELREIPASISFPAQLAWVKVGLSGSQETDWKTDWRRLQAEVCEHHRRTRLIAVAYADWQESHAPSPKDVIALAISTRAPGLLFDTFHKDGRQLFDHLSPRELRPLIDKLHAAGLFVALAGSIGLDQFPDLVALRPDLLAVRSAACDGGRNGPISAARVAALRAALISPTPAACGSGSVSTKSS
ncbi:MAG: (5-formylfuran-3-yl)methyl phosphate synthase [Planctomycetaceae bacterium]